MNSETLVRQATTWAKWQEDHIQAFVDDHYLDVIRLAEGTILPSDAALIKKLAELHVIRGGLEYIESAG